MSYVNIIKYTYILPYSIKIINISNNYKLTFIKFIYTLNVYYLYNPKLKFYGNMKNKNYKKCMIVGFCYKNFLFNFLFSSKRVNYSLYY